MTFVHTKGHSADGGNDRADLLVRWGRTGGSCSRIVEVGGVEGLGIKAVVTEPPPRVKRNHEKEPEKEGANSTNGED